LRSGGFSYDRTTKADTYLALGVRELWLIAPATVTIGVRHAAVLNDSPVWRVYRYGAGGQAESRALVGWRVSVDELFAGLVRGRV
jgi:Uma2 family endonuclease